jgi:hypothetical protein
VISREYERIECRDFSNYCRFRDRGSRLKTDELCSKRGGDKRKSKEVVFGLRQWVFFVLKYSLVATKRAGPALLPHDRLR